MGGLVQVSDDNYINPKEIRWLTVNEHNHKDTAKYFDITFYFVEESSVFSWDFASKEKALEFIRNILVVCDMGLKVFPEYFDGEIN